MTKSFRAITSSILLIILTVTVAAVQTISAQENERVLMVPKFVDSTNGRGIEIVEILVSGKPVEINKPFVAGDDWLESLVFRVKNISDKPITRFRMTFALLDTRIDADHGVGFDFSYGDWCGSNTTPPCNVKQNWKKVMPGEEVVMKFSSPDYYKNTKALALKLTGITKFNRVLVGLAQINFQDGTMTISQDLVAHK